MRNTIKQVFFQKSLYYQSRKFFWKSNVVDLEKVQNYSQLRIYQDKKFGELINLYMCNTLCQSDMFVDNADKLYQFSKNILGRSITNSLVKSTMGKAFTAGETLHDLENKLAELNAKNVPVVVGYSSEALPGDQEIPETTINDVVDMFKETIKVSSKNKNVRNIMAIKCSPIIAPMLLKKMNRGQRLIFDMFHDSDQQNQNIINVNVLRDQLKKHDNTLEDSDIAEFLTIILKRDVNVNDFESMQITLSEWIMNAHCYYVQNEGVADQNKVFYSIFSYTAKELQDIQKYCNRLKSIFAEASKHNTRVLVDAEQTYIQNAIDSITQQMQILYNKEVPIVYNTFQSYLKSTEARVRFEVERCRKLKIPFGIKLVRGAYLVEENKLAKELKYPSPIHDNIEETHKGYNQNLTYIVNNLDSGSELLIASHNEKTIRLGQKLLQEKGIDKQTGGVCFAQLYGLSDHMTYSLHKEGYKVLKYVPFGSTDIMIPYFIRRAQESKQMLSSTQLQTRLISNEILTRLKLN